MRLCIAGEVFLFDWPKGRFLPEFQAELAAFDRSGDAAKTDWHVLAEPATELLPFDDETRNARLLPSPTGPRLVLKGGQWAEIDEPRRELRLHVDDSFFTPPYTKAFCTLSSFLRLALSVLLPKHGGLVLHASSISDGPLARVFAGPSGAGKSTVAGLACGRALLGDEIALLTRGADGGFWVHPGPFFANEALGPRATAPLPLGGLYLLRQAPLEALEDLPFGPAMAAFLGTTLFVDETQEGAEPLLDSGLLLWQTGLLKQLAFRKTPDFWPLLK